MTTSRIETPMLSKKEVIAWLEDRRWNCHRIANLAGCDDKEEWLSDARYFADAIQLIQAKPTEFSK